MSKIIGGMSAATSAQNSGDIDKLLNELEKNSKNIGDLIKFKYNAVGRINIAMSMKAKTKQTLTQEQIDAYKSFNDTYSKQFEDLKELLNALNESDDLNEIQRAILNGNEIEAYDTLKTVSGYQNEAIRKLDSIISHCVEALKYLNMPGTVTA